MVHEDGGCAGEFRGEGDGRPSGPRESLQQKLCRCVSVRSEVGTRGQDSGGLDV